MEDTLKQYVCECGKVQIMSEMRHEEDFGYDQYCCSNCGHVLIDNLHGIVYCETK